MGGTPRHRGLIPLLAVSDPTDNGILNVALEEPLRFEDGENWVIELIALACPASATSSVLRVYSEEAASGGGKNESLPLAEAVGGGNNGGGGGNNGGGQAADRDPADCRVGRLLAVQASRAAGKGPLSFVQFNVWGHARAPLG